MYFNLRNTFKTAMQTQMYTFVLAVLAVITPSLCDTWKYSDQDYYPSKKTIKCYQCAYSPPRVIEKQLKVPVKDGYGKISYKTKTIKKQQPGGWDKCKGPFDDGQAMKYGIDVWDCESNCYTRTDSNGNVFRGCYRGEFGVDPSKSGCTYQAGSYYCFCDGNKCNYKLAPDFPDEGTHFVEKIGKY